MTKKVSSLFFKPYLEDLRLLSDFFDFQAPPPLKNPAYATGYIDII